LIGVPIRWAEFGIGEARAIWALHSVARKRRVRPCSRMEHIDCPTHPPRPSGTVAVGDHLTTTIMITNLKAITAYISIGSAPRGHVRGEYADPFAGF